jgi:hypothetical protein
MAQGKEESKRSAQKEVSGVPGSVPVKDDLTTEQRIKLIRDELKQKEDSVDQLKSMLEALSGEELTAEYKAKEDKKKSLRQ